MVDTPTTRNRLRKQELGTNTNTWGDTKLNEALDAIDQSMDGVLSVALSSSADYTLTTTNYSTADEAKRRVLKFTGSLSSAVNVVVPSAEHEYNVVNACGATLTVKTAAGSGIEIPTGYQARVYCDAVNVVNGSPTVLPGNVRVAGKVRNMTPGTESTDAVNKAQMESAISVLAGTSGGLVLNSSSDLAANYLINKLTVSGSLTKTTTNAGTVNEATNLDFAFDEGQGALYAGVMGL